MNNEKRKCCAICEYCVEKDRGPTTTVTAFLNLLWCKVHHTNVESFGVCDQFKQEYWATNEYPHGGYGG